ncbi:putative von Willebrand factor [Ixodes scapularis]|uniref:von Willebrand factor, putative n=1 Tax=Ixodes scapularis TaxID=6945 RepID=B7QHM0_IXOSC|nr:von Willebrand factor, putative [Ixodes scapularis]|eukprot:XP_002414677.1 von Willebrand factor, putative [Ixodes scapularis]
MKVLLLSGFLVLLAASTVSAKISPDWSRKCGPNEVFKQCVSSSCAELKCGMERMPLHCTKDCVSGCFCAPGFYRKGHTECVRRSECLFKPLKPMPKA